MTEALTVRPAIAEDRDRILDWANDPGARAAGFHPRPIAPDEHQRWFDSRLADVANGRIWIGMLGDTPIGIVRFERDSDGQLLVSIAIDAAARGRRLARPLLEAGLTVAREAFPGARFRAWIRTGNAPSLALFGGAGFFPPAEQPTATPTDAEADAVVLERD